MASKKNSNFFTVNKESQEVGIINMREFTNYESPVPGFYDIKLVPIMMGTKVVITKKEIQIPASAMTTVSTILNIEEINQLFGTKSLAVHSAMNIPAKVGYLLHGKQGSGKTTTMLAVADFLVKNYGAIAFFADDSSEVDVAYDFISRCRKLNPNQMAIVVMDECEDAMSDYEDKMKKLLDSNETPSNFVFLASTNYIEDIPDTIKDRPSRFKYVTDCSNLNGEEDQVYQIFKAMNMDLPADLKLTDSQLKTLTPRYVNKTIDELKHAFVSEAAAPDKVIPKAKKPKKIASAELN
jgi:energy-coupling factor transporter ATP-binding protein EcfA2